jgi:phosphate starvation-inducible PhoH-like protein
MSKTSNGKHSNNQQLHRWQEENLLTNGKKYGNGDPKIFLANDLKAMTPNQELYIESLNRKTVTIVYGPAGTGKSMCAIGVAAKMFAEGKIKKILIARSLVDCGKQMPALPGDLDDKIRFHFASYIEYLTYFLGPQEVHRAFLNESIMLRPIEMLRGHTYKNTYMIADEAQNLAKKQIKMFMSRIGEGSKIALLGDHKQSDNHENGLSFCVDNMQDSRHLHVCQLTRDDILRHPIIAEILEVFDEE